jgi:hypothetical protein
MEILVYCVSVELTVDSVVFETAAKIYPRSPVDVEEVE